MSSDESEELKAAAGKLLRELRQDDYVRLVFEPEWYVHLTEEFNLKSAELYKGTTEEELGAFLIAGTDVTLEEFNAHSPKGLGRLNQELEREVNLWKLGPGSFLKVSTKARTQIHAPSEGLVLKEVSRYVVESDHEIIHDVPKDHASSGTLQRRRRIGKTIVGEFPAKAAQREVEQEHGVWLDLVRFIPLTIGVPKTLPPRPSSMYQCPGITIESIDVVWEFRINVPSVTRWHSPKLHARGNILEFDDEGVHIRVAWLREKN